MRNKTKQQQCSQPVLPNLQSTGPMAMGAQRLITAAAGGQAAPVQHSNAARGQRLPALEQHARAAWLLLPWSIIIQLPILVHSGPLYRSSHRV